MSVCSTRALSHQWPEAWLVSAIRLPNFRWLPLLACPDLGGHWHDVVCEAQARVPLILPLGRPRTQELDQNQIKKHYPNPPRPG